MIVSVPTFRVPASGVTRSWHRFTAARSGLPEKSGARRTARALGSIPPTAIAETLLPIPAPPRQT